MAIPYEFYYKAYAEKNNYISLRTFQKIHESSSI
jgi:hypothetical protein